MSTTTFATLDQPTASHLEPQIMRANPAHAAGTVFELIRTRAGFDALESEWNALFARAGRSEQMFMTFNWLWHWANHYLDRNAELAIVSGRRNGQLLLLWPLMVERPAGLRQLAFLGAPVSQYGDALVDTGLDRTDVLDRSWHFIIANLKPDLVRLAKVRVDAVIAPLLAAKGFRITAQEEAPYASLAAVPSYAAFDERFSPKLRKNRRRQLRRLEERGPIVVEHLSGGQPARDAVRLAMTLKRAWLNERGLVSKAFADERIDTFFADASSSVARPCGVAISELRTNGECADLSISVTCKGRQAIHILSYALKFEKFGAGNHHLEVAMQRAFEDGVAVYDFLAPRHAYKMEWADGVVAVNDQVLALSPLGNIYADLYLAKVRESLKSLLKRLPLRLRRLIGGARKTVTGL